MTTSPTGRAIIFLSSVCDGAHSTDGQGFSRYDARTGHDLANKLTTYGNFASEKQLNFARKITVKYRRQLDEAGFCLAEIRAEVFEASVREVKVSPDVTVLCSVVSSSDKAIRVIVRRGNSSINTWLPKSQVIDTQPAADSGFIHLTVTAWIAEQKGFAA